MKRVSGQPGMLRAIGRFIEAPYNGFLALQSADPIERPWTEDAARYPAHRPFTEKRMHKAEEPLWEFDLHDY